MNRSMYSTHFIQFRSTQWLERQPMLQTHQIPAFLTHHKIHKTGIQISSTVFAASLAPRNKPMMLTLCATSSLNQQDILVSWPGSGRAPRSGTSQSSPNTSWPCSAAPLLCSPPALLLWSTEVPCSKCSCRHLANPLFLILIY